MHCMRDRINRFEANLELVLVSLLADNERYRKPMVDGLLATRQVDSCFPAMYTENSLRHPHNFWGHHID